MDIKEFEDGTFYNADCMDVLKDMQDKQFDICLTDPPYGIDYGGQLKGLGDGNGGSNKHGWKSWNAPEWDKERPKKEFFDQMRRVSKNQIIWGGELLCRFSAALSRVDCLE